MKIGFTLLLVLLFGDATRALSGVYKQIDEHGNVTYSNVQINNAEKIDLPPIVVVPSVDAEGVDDRIKQRRENKIITEQRNALEEKIADETERLESIKAEYQDGNPDRLGSERNYQRYLDRVERLKKEISLREANLRALQQQLEALPHIE
ncbi:hypothetical protein SAMN05216302_100133 [Nitrosomonas aestuarii]|uniref:DUF4124 domain-containing protein n=1 Tax=Nitrosomonas aestuarii TaxID=52441 RepID=A0A1I3WZZ0_9PROT|nr:DUF4124 domain-containing protein [Nitrosomonas aestuarii]SFK12507.1 hypothetical protein SAMN05216302_100133 [Nitrosomonas aestuarii]